MLVRSEKSKLYEITLIGEPFQSSNKSKYEVNFSIRNLSNDPWSSVSKNPNYGGINIGCRQVNESGQPMDYNDNRLHIPLMLIPNKDYYFSMTFPKKEYLLGTSFIIEPLQEGNEWFGNGVVVNKQKFKK
jgi:hypothetical protein